MNQRITGKQIGMVRVFAVLVLGSGLIGLGLST
jgi:hypothetical protein